MSSRWVLSEVCRGPRDLSGSSRLLSCVSCLLTDKVGLARVPDHTQVRHVIAGVAEAERVAA